MTSIPAARRLIAGLLGAAFALCATSAPAQTAPYPSRPIRMIVSVGAGGATDTVTRRLAERLQKSLGQAVIVENIAGASGVIAAQTVARAAPDGYTLLVLPAAAYRCACMAIRKPEFYEAAALHQLIRG
jgi:tripartite-type tricarboxylate transporter receptor subunit TctC